MLPILLGLLMASHCQESDEVNRLLFEFSNAQTVTSWQIVNDGVMGGRSTGRIRVTENRTMKFSGTLSLENNGGFASIRSPARELKLESEDIIVIRVLGDGRVYNCNLYANGRNQGYSFRQAFATKSGEWTEVELPVSKFVATFRGQVFPDQKLDPSRVVGLGILLGDKRPGPFRLEADWIKVSSRKSK